MPLRALAVLSASVLLAGCAAATRVSFDNVTPGAPVQVKAEEYRPGGNGPFPALVLMHGCHGVSDSVRGWGRWFRERGYVAMVVDSWSSRGLQEQCTPGVDLPNTARFDDAIGALRWLHAQPYVDRARIGIIGWSNGGAFSMAAVNGPTHERTRRRGVEIPPPGYQAAVGVYPGACFSLIEQLSVKPVLILIGGDDDWTSTAECQELVTKQRAKGADVSIVVYPGAVHYFDVEGQKRVFLPEVENKNAKTGTCCGATVGFDAAANADAHRRVGEFFARHLGGRP
ncbi:MAG TPA: dienelactone hydrolase family protein [Methylomirabilota bacterium]|jgi:dienelactone hydrolase|nr:dienelactone hydrolase family protein [Methylomirabilota bacterium]